MGTRGEEKGHVDGVGASGERQATAPTDDQAIEAETQGREDQPVRRRLLLLLGLLSVALLALIGLLLWLLRPQPPPRGAGVPEGYPIRVVTSIYGYGTKPDELLKTPLGVAFDRAGNVWISDTGHSRVLVFTTGGHLVRTVGATGPGKVSTPYGIAADPLRDRMYVSDWAGRAVDVYSTSGSYLGRLPADDQDLRVFGPNGFSPYDAHVVNGRVVASSNDGLYFFDSNGHVVARWGGKVRGVRLGMFNFPDAFAVDSVHGQIYVADSLNRRIEALDFRGRWLWISGRPDQRGKVMGFWQLPRGILVGPDGNLYVVDTFRFSEKGVGVGHIVVLSPTGDLRSEFGRSGGEEDAFNFPEKMAVGRDGLFALADRESNRVVLFRLGPLPGPDRKEAASYRSSFLGPQKLQAIPPAGR